jgi:hypothetical protein
MLFLIQNQALTQNQEITYVTSPAAAAATTLTVKAVDNFAWAEDDYIIVGTIGTPNSEVVQIDAAVSDGTSLTTTALRFAHAANEPVYHISYNQIRIYRSTTVDGAKTLLTTIDLMPENFESRYQDNLNNTGYGFAAFYNSTTTQQSPYSDAIPYTGQESGALSSMVSKVRTLINEPKDNFISDQEIVDAINDKQRDILNKRLWTFNEVELSMSSVAQQFAYDLPTQIKTLHSMRFRTIPQALISEARWEMLHWNTNQSSSWPMSVAVWNNQIKIYPTPAQAAYTTTLTAGISASDTSIPVVATTSTAGMYVGDYYRFIIDDEVIYATNATTSTEFEGCLRGMEGTTAAAHLNGATVTERDIVFNGQANAVDLVEQNDVTVVPEPLVICYGVAADFYHGKLEKPTLGDRMDLKFQAGMTELTNRYSIKMTSQPNRVKDPSEVIMDDGVWRNPNDFPYNVQAPS